MIGLLLAAVERRHPEADGRWWLTREWRRIDVLAVECWHPFRRVAYELKTSRSDWLAELRRPDKQAFARSIADELYVGALCGVVRTEELPDGCGLVEVARDGSWTLTQPARVQSSRELERPEVADLLRRRLNPFDRQRELRELRTLRAVVADRGIAVPVAA